MNFKFNKYDFANRFQLLITLSQVCVTVLRPFHTRCPLTERHQDGKCSDFELSSLVAT